MSSQAPDTRRGSPSYEGSGSRRSFTETKESFKTSELYVMLAFVAGVLIATYVESDDAINRDDGWLIAGIVVVAYLISRGLAKLGTREPYREDYS